MNRLIKRLAEAKALGITGEALLRYVGVKLAGVNNTITFDAARKPS